MLDDASTLYIQAATTASLPLDNDNNSLAVDNHPRILSLNKKS